MNYYIVVADMKEWNCWSGKRSEGGRGIRGGWYSMGQIGQIAYYSFRARIV